MVFVTSETRLTISQFSPSIDASSRFADTARTKTGGWSRGRGEPFATRTCTLSPYRACDISDDVNVSRQKPYERPPNPMSVVPHDAPATGRDVPSRKQVNGATLGQLFQKLASLAKDPSTFESKASVVCASFDLDPTTSMEIVASFKQQQSADQTQGPRCVQSRRAIGTPSLTSSFNLFRTPPVGTSGPTTSEPIDQRASDTLAPETIAPIPIRHQRPFVSGPKGSTVWYTTASNQPISSPPASLPASSGILYIHTNLATKTNQVWLCSINARWIDITTMDSIRHPSVTDRILLLRSDGIPSWLTSTNHATVQSRKERAGR